jgi:hypothetical protein
MPLFFAMRRIPKRDKAVFNGREETPATLLEEVSFLCFSGACLALFL